MLLFILQNDDICSFCIKVWRGTPNNSAGVVIKLAGWQMNQRSIPGTGSWIFFSPKRPGRLLGLAKSAIYEYEILFFLSVTVAGARSWPLIS
jgi:hypothetical protein